MIKKIFYLLFSFILFVFPQESVWGACGGTVRTWDAGGGSTNWGTNSNWNPNNKPDTPSEDALIVAASRVTKAKVNATIGCLEIQSGQLTSRDNRTLTITGDYFRNLTLNGLSIKAAHTNFAIEMAGTGPQTFENVDPVNVLIVSNNSTVTFTQSFSIRNALNLTGSSTTLIIQGDLQLEAGSTPLTIPAGVTVEVSAGVTLTALEGITVNGTLNIKNGATVVIGNGKTLQVNSGGLLQLQGASGNVASIVGNGAGSSFSFNVAGIINASYFRIDRMDAAGINVTGTLQAFDNGEIHYIANAGYALTLGASAIVPATMDSVGFFDDAAYGNNKNFNASAYNAGSVTVNNWSGSVGGATKENDPNGKIIWGPQAGTELTLSNNTASGSPPSTINQSSGDTLFATFAFALNQSSAATDITQVKLTMSGTASASDIQVVKVYKDAAGGSNCVYDAGVDTQIGGNLTLSGTPPTTTVTIPPGDVQTSSDTNVACIHVLAATSATAQDAKTIQFEISGTADVVNSQGYSFSSSSGPPVAAGSSTINGSPLRTWQGDVDNRWNRGGNWQGTGYPNSSRDCKVGSGVNITHINIANAACLNATLQTGGTIDFLGSTNELAAYGSLDVQSGYTFLNATTGVLAMRGSGNQSFNLTTAFPGNFLVANTGTAPNDQVSVSSDSEIQGTLTISSGTLVIPAGVTLTVLGNVTVQSGGTLEVQAGGTLALGNGVTLTVNSGGTLKIVGSSSQDAVITSNGATSAYNVIVNGTIQAQYYKFDHLNTSGVSIEAGATIDPTYHLQNGSFTYPVNNSTTMLFLKQQVPTNTMNNMSFDSAGSTATGVINIDTTGAAAGTLSINTYSGDLSGPSQDNTPSYLINWVGATNTINITQEATTPATLNAGQTYVMGRFGFQQNQAGASFVDTDLTSLTLTLTGTGASSDVDLAKVYYDSNCDSLGGTLIGSGTFVGNPPTLTFSFNAGDVTIPADVASPPMRCLYVEFDIAAGAGDGNTLGVKINASSDVANSQNYAASGTTTFPVTLGPEGTINGSSQTIWTGTVNTDWFNASNWSAGVPTSSKNCTINNAANNPQIDGNLGTATCNSVDIGNGTLTLVNGTGAVLEVWGNFTNTGSFVSNDGVLRLADGGTALTQSVSSSSVIGSLSFSKTAGGIVNVAGSSALTINALNFSAGNPVVFTVPNGKTLILPNGVTIPAGTLKIDGGGTVQIGNTKTITVNGGTFQVNGTQDRYPQNDATKGKVTVQGTGKWGFLATSGTIDMVGWIMDYIDENGLQFQGTTNITNFRGGHFSNLSTNYAALTAIHFDTPNVPATVANVGWDWGPNNTPPPYTAGYFLASSTGCGGNTITFDEWFGDFFDDIAQQPDTNTKISETNCNIVISYSASPVSMVFLKATGYNGKVAVDWVTGSEVDHLGFNVYRSQNPLFGFVQVNSQLIRNQQTSTSYKGTYQFIDTTVTNGEVYYYMVEDVATNGAKTMHGPVFAVPVVSAGDPPPPDGSTNTGGTDSGADTGNGPSNGPIQNPGLVDLGNGVHVISQTLNSLRVEIIPPAVTYTPSSWNPSYEEVSIPGYSKTLTAGAPEILEKVILVEVDADNTTAQLSSQQVIENPVSTHQIVPAPSWSPDNTGQLVPSWNPDPVFYGDNSFQPGQFFQLDSQLVSLQGKKYVKITVHPLLYNAVTQDVRSVKKIILDIGLGGQAWSQPSSPPDLTQSPAAVPGVLRIQYSQSGMYELTYDDLVAAGVEGPFVGVNTSDLRLYFRGVEQAIDVIDSDGVFNSGDSIRFYANFYRKVDDSIDEVVLSTQPLGNSTGPALRAQVLDGSPSGWPLDFRKGTYARKEVEKDSLFLIDLPMGGVDTDHFFWKRIAKWNGSNTTPIPQFFTITNIDLSGLVPVGTVYLNVHLRGRANYAKNPTHHLGVWVNTVPYRVADAVFHTQDPTVVRLSVPAYYFVDGLNSIKLEAMPDTVPPGDLEVLDIDRLEVEYTKAYEAVGDQLEIYNPLENHAIQVQGFSSNAVQVYDISDPQQLARLSNVVIQPSNLLYNVQFRPSLAGDYGYRLLAIADGTYLKPQSMFLNPGFEMPLKSPNNRADLIFIGSETMLDAARDLADHRRTQGLFVKEVSLDQIYAEFSDGIQSIRAVKDFLTYARTYWQKPAPQYVLLLADATYDPRDREGWGKNKNVMPVAFEKGLYVDFGSDNWLVSNDNGFTPEMAIGRIPASTPEELKGVVNKILDYEAGKRSPSQGNFMFFSDGETLFEGFSKKAEELASGLSSPRFQKAHIKRSSFTQDALMKQSILDSFSSDQYFFMTFVGHGIEDMWASYSVFSASDVKGLKNQVLPIVMGLNCFTGYYYDADLSFKSLGEELVLNPDGGAVAYWGSPAMTIPESQVNLSKKFFAQLLQETNKPFHMTRLGDLILASKKALGAIPSMSDTVRSWTLLGDPAMKLPEGLFAPKPVSHEAPPRGGGCGRVSVGPFGGDSGGAGPFIFLILLAFPILALSWIRRRVKKELISLQ
ncbi:MAG: hypothetical protein D6797_03270 [Bdellovibrio sp.]|nr:MAG: hypothetical protein D6797_03270 [Bdellovibrio sp.]